MNSHRRVVGYLRVSTTKQLNGKGLAEQKAAIEQYARQAMQIDLRSDIPSNRFELYIEMPWSGEKGTADKRPELQAALTDVCGSNGILIVRDITRLARSLPDNLDILNRLKDCGCDVVSIREAVSSLIWGKAQAFAWAAELGEFRLRQLRRHATEGAARHKAKGKRWGRVPFGYLRSTDGQSEPHPDQYPVLMEIVERLNDGQSLYSIAKLLNSRQIRTQTGKLWEPRQVANAYDMHTKHNL